MQRERLTLFAVRPDAGFHAAGLRYSVANRTPILCDQSLVQTYQDLAELSYLTHFSAADQRHVFIWTSFEFRVTREQEASQKERCYLSKALLVQQLEDG